MNLIFFRKDYKIGNCSSLFLVFYGIFSIFSEIFREPDMHLGYIYGLISMGMALSFFMILVGIILFYKK